MFGHAESPPVSGIGPQEAPFQALHGASAKATDVLLKNGVSAPNSTIQHSATRNRQLLENRNTAKLPFKKHGELPYGATRVAGRLRQASQLDSQRIVAVLARAEVQQPIGGRVVPQSDSVGAQAVNCRCITDGAHTSASAIASLRVNWPPPHIVPSFLLTLCLGHACSLCDGLIRRTLRRQVRRRVLRCPDGTCGQQANY